MLDKIIIEFDKMIRTLYLTPLSKREHPDIGNEEALLSEKEKRQVIRMMRINHCGEICAQALYQGQALTSRDKANKYTFEESADEETEHLAWTLARLKELGSGPSKLIPFFYFTSLATGVAAGIMGDKWSLGFLAETEKQVELHLQEHLDKLPPQDLKSIAILEQMKKDEIAHGEKAKQAGAAKLPAIVKQLMQFSSKIMTKTTYYI